MSFLPTDYKAPESTSHYMKLEDGENTFRVLGSAITGYEYWIEEGGKRTPNRVKSQDDLPKDVQQTQDRQKQAKHFWAFPVLNRQTSEVQILELTQKTLMKQIMGLVESKNWGDPKAYDLTITRRKTGSEARDVEYSVMPQPKEALDEGIAQYYKDLNIDLNKLFVGGDPFATEA